MPEEIGGGCGQPGYEELAAQALDDFHKHRFAGGLDFTIVSLLRLPLVLCISLECHMQFVKSWRVFGLPRKRYIQWDACTADTPLVSDHGIPQGDAFSPLALSCLLTAGLSFVKRQTDHLPGEAKHYIYISISLSRSLSVDDRSWTSSKASKVIAILQAWFAWSQAIGLCENPSKTPLTALTPKLRQELCNCSPEQQFVKDDLQFFGTTTVPDRSAKIPRENSKDLMK